MTLAWMGLLVVVLIGAWRNALKTKYDGVGDFYSVTVKELKHGRITIECCCSDDSKSFLFILTSNTVENIFELSLPIRNDEVPATLTLGCEPGSHFHRTVTDHLVSAIALYKNDRLLKERLLIAHDLIQFVFDQSLMKITQRQNFHVEYNVEQKLISLGKIP